MTAESPQHPTLVGATGSRPELVTRCEEGLAEFDGHAFYVIPDLHLLSPFLMSLVSDSDHWGFISSTGALTAGRRDAATALFPYETDDRLHLSAGISGSATVLRVGRDDTSVIWEPFGRHAAPGVRRGIAKAILSDRVIFEEINEHLGLAFRYRWSTSERFGFVREAELFNVGDSPRPVGIVDGIANVLPAGLVPDQYRSMSNLTNAYRRSELVDGTANLALHTLEAMMVDQAMPAEALRATVTWSTSPAPGAVTVARAALDAARAGELLEPVHLVTGRPGAHLTVSEVTLAPRESCAWYVVADVAKDHSAVADLLANLRGSKDVALEIEASVQRGSAALAAKVGSADGVQVSGDADASAHHAANVLFNIMRGGVFDAGYRCSAADFAGFVETRNRNVAREHAATLAALPAELDRDDLLEQATATGDPDLERLALEYLPLTFSRRHGDPSRPWNQFSIRVRDPDGTPILSHEGNWRDIFQNWEALCLSFPEYLPSVVSVFVNASTPDGFNPYRITRAGIDWETLDPDDPWSNIGYWGDHQIVYLLRLLEAADRLVPGAIESLLDRRVFTYAGVPYRLKSYEDLVADPHATIEFDDAAADRAHRRTKEIGADGKLVADPAGGIYRVSLLEKLVVPILSKLSNYVPEGGIWMNTQRPEWNDANNALVGYGLSMVTLYHLRRYASWLLDLTANCDIESIAMSTEVVDWMAEVTGILRAHGRLADSGADDRQRADLMGELGEAFSAYRSKIYAAGFSGTVEVAMETVRELCAAALPHLDATIRANRRIDGLYHSYNLIRFEGDGEVASIDQLPEMLEGQVAALSCGILEPLESADLIDALFKSALYRPDQDSFILYPDRRPPPFLDKNVIPEELVLSNPLFCELIAAGDDKVVTVDVNGVHHFNPGLHNASDLADTLDSMASGSPWQRLVETHRSSTVAAYEAVFDHHAFTGRSGTMYAYEGLGSIYWHMVAKLLVAAQECVMGAHRSGADPGVVDRLRRSYYRIRGGLGFNKTAAEYGAFPTDPYSHTPAHAGAQQPGMTGQVKEELLTRPGELGVWAEDGELCFDPVLLRSGEFLTEPAAWTFFNVDGDPRTISLEPGSFGMTICQVPIVVSAADGATRIDVERSDGSATHVEGMRLDHSLSREIFERSGTVAAVGVRVPLPAPA